MALVAGRMDTEIPWPVRTSAAGADSKQVMTQRVSHAVRRAQAGDRAALGFLYARYADNIHAYVRSIVRDSHEAEDVTQQVFSKLIHVIGKYEERDGTFFAWIVQVAHNLAVDHLRCQRVISVEEVRTTSEACSNSNAAERMTDLREALTELPKDQREVVVLRHFAGLSPAEIAARTGRSDAATHGLHHRGRRALRAELACRGVAPATVAAARPKETRGDQSDSGRWD
jgi:RNA polymerase sigma-70 factor (ECF subfamily)